MPHARVKHRRKLSRTHGARQALLRSLAYHLIMQESITTTKPKAKALIPFAERLITRAKQGTLHSRRLVTSRLGNAEAAGKLCDELIPRLSGRTSGHLRIKSAQVRAGDQAKMSEVSLILDEAAKAQPPQAKRPAAKQKAASRQPKINKDKS